MNPEKKEIELDDQLETDEVRDQHTTSRTGDAIRGRTDGAFTTSGTGGGIRGRTDETSVERTVG